MDEITRAELVERVENQWFGSAPKPIDADARLARQLLELVELVARVADECQDPL